MNLLAALNRVKTSLQKEAILLEQLWLDHSTTWQQLDWSLAQVKLWLACLPDIQINLNSEGATTYQWLLKGRVSEKNSLADELVALLKQAG